MESVRIFCLVVATVVSATAFLGVSSAGAEITTQLCKNDESLCGAGNAVTHVHFISLGSKVKLLSSLGTVECDMLFLGDVLTTLVLWQVIHGNFTYTNCSSPTLGTCSATETSASALIEVMKVVLEEAEVKGSGEVLVECGSFLHCVYKDTGFLGEAKGSLLSGHVTLTEQIDPKVSGFICPETTKLDLLMGTLPTEPIYISL